MKNRDSFQGSSVMADRFKKKDGNKKSRMFSSRELFGDEREIYIRHSDRQYRLQITKAGKLILNK